MNHLTDALPLDQAMGSFFHALRTTFEWIAKTLLEKSPFHRNTIHQIAHLIDDSQVEMFEDYWRDLQLRRREEINAETGEQRHKRDVMMETIRDVMIRYRQFYELFQEIMTPPAHLL